MIPSSTPTLSTGKKAFLTPVSVLLIFGLLAGVLFSIFIPYGAGFDEEQHVIRIMDISFLHMLPNRSKNATMTYREFYSLSYQRRFFNDPAGDLFSPENFLKKLDPAKRLRAQTRSIYPPVIFFPQAFVAGVFWRILNLPVIPVVILERLAGLLLYLAGTYFTLRLLPLGKWVFAALALSPMALYQAATLNTDGFTNAVSFLFIGLTLSVYADQGSTVRPWQIWSLAGLAILLGLAKPGSIVLLPLLLILVKHRFPSKTMIAVLCAGAVLAVIVTAGWTAISVPNSHFAESGSQDIGHQLQVVLAHPGNFVLTFFTRTLSSIGRYFRDWTGVYGYWVGEVPEPVYTLYPLVLVAALLAEPRDRRFSWIIRGFLIALFLASSAAIAFLYYYLHYSPGDMSSLGKQGRYFIPMAPLLLIALSGLVSIPQRIRNISGALATVLLALVIGYYSFGLYATYYTECGYAVYAGKSCTLPAYKNLDIQNPPVAKVNTRNTVSQTFTSRCGSVESVQVLVESVPHSAGTLRYSLLDGGGKVLSTQDIPVTKIQAKSFITLPVAPPTGKNSAVYEIRLESPDVAPSEGIAVALREGGYYRDGELRISGIKAGVDSVFQYSCPNARLQEP